MANFAEKEQILTSNGYRYSFDRELYVNKSKRSAFSVEFLEDHSESEIEKLAQDDSMHSEWRFFFNTAPSVTVRRELANILG